MESAFSTDKFRKLLIVNDGRDALCMAKHNAKTLVFAVIQATGKKVS